MSYCGIRTVAPFLLILPALLGAADGVPAYHGTATIDNFNKSRREGMGAHADGLLILLILRIAAFLVIPA